MPGERDPGESIDGRPYDTTDRTLKTLYASPPPAASRTRQGRQRVVWAACAAGCLLVAVGAVGAGHHIVTDEAALNATARPTTTTQALNDLVLSDLPSSELFTPGSVPAATGTPPMASAGGTSTTLPRGGTEFRDPAGWYTLQVGPEWVGSDTEMRVPGPGRKAVTVKVPTWRVGLAGDLRTAQVMILTMDFPKDMTTAQLLPLAEDQIKKQAKDATVDVPEIVTTVYGQEAGRVRARASAGNGVDVATELFFIVVDGHAVIIQTSCLAGSSDEVFAAIQPFTKSLQVKAP